MTASNPPPCVDASGDVYQWGDTFFGSEHTESKRPQLTLRGKNIVSLAVTPSKVFALSASGKIYVLSSTLHHELASHSIQNIWSLFGSSTPQTLFAVLGTDVPLAWGERFTSISAGSDHLLALTSLGRTFAHPVTRSANWHSQLGLRKIFILDPVDSSKRLPLELHAKPTRDSLGNEIVPSPEAYRSEAQSSDPSMTNKSGSVQVVAGDRTSFIVTRDGRVLGWGANEYGQLARAGGDLTFSTVERELPNGGTVVDVLACGNGDLEMPHIPMHKTSETPLYVRCTRPGDENTGIRPSSSGHVIATLDTISLSHPSPNSIIAISAADSPGRDVLTWGLNQHHQLGNRKRASINAPVPVETADRKRLTCKVGSGKIWYVSRVTRPLEPELPEPSHPSHIGLNYRLNLHKVITNGFPTGKRQLRRIKPRDGAYRLNMV
ncbi:regulator of chromosome condensation 1/beta-lactamase-inhibitor protein II [Gautieria morchelliformis]|nr:regulator of chromosome condensation 1/beta-lactamase-inhibitor protein II [Gautieria morchelliformis]